MDPKDWEDFRGYTDEDFGIVKVGEVQQEILDTLKDIKDLMEDFVNIARNW